MKVKRLTWTEAKYGYWRGTVEGVPAFGGALFTYGWSPDRTSTKERPWRLTSSIPGLKSWACATPELAQERAQSELEKFVGFVTEEETPCQS